MSEIAVLGHATTYNEMLAAVRGLMELRGLSSKQLDELAGLPEGYTGKFLGGAQVKRMGTMAMWPVFAALSTRIQFIDDPNQVDRLKQFYGERSSNQARPGNRSTALRMELVSRVCAQIGIAGRRRRWRKIPKAKRSEQMRELAMKRWARVRKDRSGKRRWKGTRPK